jgi:SAM-dependent methyltransferase
MCNSACIEFGRTWLHKEDVQNQCVIEVGSRNVNGSLRSGVEALGPASYVGVDLFPGPGVDVVCDAEDLVARFGENSFDLLICTEVVEHVRRWQVVINNFKALLKPNGHLLLTTRSFGFPQHDYPFDFWRYEIADMEAIFGDFEIEQVQPDPSMPGVFVKARKPQLHRTPDLSGYRLFSMVRNRRVCDITDFDLMLFAARQTWRRLRLGEKPDWLRRYFTVPQARLRSIIHAHDQSIHLPFGHVDSPQNDAPQTGKILVCGWALGWDRVAEVSVYLDGRFAVSAFLGGARPDVAAHFPQIPGGHCSGWSCEIDISNCPQGRHELLVQALSEKGATRDIGCMHFLANPGITDIS